MGQIAYGFVRSLPPRKSAQEAGEKRNKEKSETKGRERDEGKKGEGKEERGGPGQGKGIQKGDGEAGDEVGDGADVRPPLQPPLGKWSKALARLEKQWGAYKVKIRGTCMGRDLIKINKFIRT